MTRDRQYYLDLFQVSERLLESLTCEGLSSGGSYCDLFFENTTSTDLLLRDGKVSTGGFNVDYGVGIRVLKGERTGYAYSESTDPKQMMNAVAAAAKIAVGSTSMPDRGCPVMEQGGRYDRYPMVSDWRDGSAETFVPYLERLRDKIAAKDSRIVKIIASLSNQVSDILMYNSLGELAFDTRPLAVVSVSVIFSENGRIENKSASRSFRTGTEMLGEALLDELAGEVVKGVDERFAAKRPKGGRMPVVMGAGASGILLHEAMGHAFEADFNRKGQSIFADKLGKQVCPKEITIVDDGTIAGNRGAVNYDDEGIPGQRTCMVENGVLTSFLHDRVSAAFYGIRSTGNGRRENFRYAPIPRMRATYMENGPADRESIVSSVKKGIYVDEFSNGQVQIGEGDFTFFVKSGFLIENGRLTQPVKDINIIGNGPAALADIVAVGNDLMIDNGAWTCGKGQSCPVSCGIPTILIKELTVGGE